MSDASDYKAAFDGEYCNQNDVSFRAFEKAVATRNFEIELYWKRATYSWTLIAVTFAGYFAVQGASSLSLDYKKRLFSFIIGCAGFIFSLAWFFVNKGSKFWQENWENHVAILGRPIVGPLYSWVLARPQRGCSMVTDPAAISVSKINQWVSLYVLIIWGILIVVATPFSDLITPTLLRHPFYGYFSAIIANAFFIWKMWCGSKTNLGSHGPVLLKSKTRLSNQ